MMWLYQQQILCSSRFPTIVQLHSTFSENTITLTVAVLFWLVYSPDICLVQNLLKLFQLWWVLKMSNSTNLLYLLLQTILSNCIVCFKWSLVAFLFSGRKYRNRNTTFILVLIMNGNVFIIDPMATVCGTFIFLTHYPSYNVLWSMFNNSQT